jgi:hypothetical protein
MFLIPLSICAFVVTRLNTEIAQIAESICTTEPSLRCTTPPLEGQPKPSGDDQLHVKQNVDYADTKIYRDNRWLNRLTLSPFTNDEFNATYKCHEKKTNTYRACNPYDYHNPAEAVWHQRL